MENTIEQQVLSMIAANPGITVRRIHAFVNSRKGIFG